MNFIELSFRLNLGGKISALCHELLQRRNRLLDLILFIDLPWSVSDHSQQLGIAKCTRSRKFEHPDVKGRLQDEFEAQSTLLGKYTRFHVGELAASLKSFDAFSNLIA